MIKNKNICKFISEKTESGLQTSRFIFETELKQGAFDYSADTNRVYLITQGEGSIIICGKEHFLKTGSIVFIMAGMIYTLLNKKQLCFMYIDYSGNRGDILINRFKISENNNVFDGMSWLIPIWKESLVKANKANIDILSESMLLFAFSQLNNENTVHDASSTVVDYVNEHFSDNSLTLAAISAELGYNTKYLSHMFIKKTGISFSDYLKEIRLRQAVLLINQGITSVKNISILCGFSDPLYFSKVFKQKFGISPREYINKQNK